ncbi:MAG: phosphate ABC transporter permease subunit PstC, partial [Silvibacterium sp.]|nr:phosphate ABC transporter permease subunit PstC [Silvibacterium sp.]
MQPVRVPGPFEAPSPAGEKPRTPPLGAEPSAIRKFLLSRGSSAMVDSAFRWLMLVCALAIFAIVALIFWELTTRSQLTIHKFGIKFFFGSAWDPVNGNFGALPFVFGTLVSSLIALIIAVPLAVGVAIFITEMCPRMLRGPLSFLTELLAAIPSVV